VFTLWFILETRITITEVLVLLEFMAVFMLVMGPEDVR